MLVFLFSDGSKWKTEKGYPNLQKMLPEAFAVTSTQKLHLTNHQFNQRETILRVRLVWRQRWLHSNHTGLNKSSFTALTFPVFTQSIKAYQQMQTSQNMEKFVTKWMSYLESSTQWSFCFLSNKQLLRKDMKFLALPATLKEYKATDFGNCFLHSAVIRTSFLHFTL